MPYPIERKLVIAVASSALFDLRESDKVFIAEGPKAYKEYQEKKIMLNKNVINKIKNKLNYNQEKILGYLL